MIGGAETKLNEVETGDSDTFKEREVKGR